MHHFKALLKPSVRSLKFEPKIIELPQIPTVGTILFNVVDTFEDEWIVDKITFDVSKNLYTIIITDT